MVRCTNHPGVLNLSFNGEITQSGAEWETNFAAVSRPEQLRPEFLLQKYFYLKVIRIPEREPGSPAEMVDLTSHYNGALTGWLRVAAENDVNFIKDGRTLIDGVSFDIRGVIQLGSLNSWVSSWPVAVSNVVVGVHCEELAFLQGAIGKGGELKVEVGHYVIRFESGSNATIPITYGVNVLDWTESDPGTLMSLEESQKNLASGRTGIVQESGKRLYVFHWPNPHRNLRIQSIDFVSAMSQSSPFLVAVSGTPLGQIDEKGQVDEKSTGP
jgi:hypothetical protein